MQNRKKANDSSQRAVAQALFGAVDDFRLERGALGVDARINKSRLDPNVDLVRINDEAVTTTVGGLGKAGAGFVSFVTGPTWLTDSQVMA